MLGSHEGTASNFGATIRQWLIQKKSIYCSVIRVLLVCVLYLVAVLLNVILYDNDEFEEEKLGKKK